MKKVIAFILLICMLSTITACKEEPPTAYSPNTDAEVTVAYIYNGCANIATRILTDQPLKSITITCIYYDITGKQIDTRRLAQCQISDSNRIHLWQISCPELAVYIDCVVYETQRADDTVCTAEGIEFWERDSLDAFKIDTYHSTLDKKLAEPSACAESTPYGSIALLSWNDSEITVSLQDLNDHKIGAVYLFALWFDKGGEPLNTGVCDYCKNGELMLAKIDSPDAHTYLFDAPENAASVKLIVQSVDFEDGTSWINPYCYEWIVYNRNRGT